ncbi:26190_t:CDS:1, partial [Gigaspora rosea]
MQLLVIHKLESFRIQLKEELEKISENRCRRSKAKWIEKGNAPPNTSMPDIKPE